jgi:hypothetical protein
MVHVVKDRIQDQTIVVKHINMFCMFFWDPFIEGLVTPIYDYVAGMGC